jgi:dTDP-L-rhamnose 4-epimerase
VVRVLVTGGAGFIGSHVVDLLVAGGNDVVVVDALHPRAHGSTPDYLNDGARYIWGDIADGDLVERSLAGVDAVCHQASMVGLGVDFDDVEAYVRTNALGTAVLLRAMYGRRFGGRLVLASSMVVYGEGRYRCSLHGLVDAEPRPATAMNRGMFDFPCRRCGRTLSPEPVPEDAPLEPRNVYAATKAHQEHLCFAFGRETGIDVISLRYHNVYGPRMPRDTPYAGVASVFRSALEDGRGPRVFEDGHQRRDFIHVRDVARANLLALEAPRGTSGPFNVASGRPHTVGDVATTLSAPFGSDARPVVTGEWRPGDVRHLLASPDRAARELGFRAEVRFEDGMQDFASDPLRAPASQSPATVSA